MSALNPPPTPNEKAGGQPHPPRSAFVCFSHAKERTFKDKSDEEKHVQLVATEWNALTDRDRAEWAEVARKDKLRFLREREQSKESTIAPKRRAKKDPNAPRRPMSAFLAFSQARRAEVKEKNPTMDNTDISRLLGSIWKTAPISEKARFIDAEKVQRANYKEEMRKFRLRQAKVHTADSQLEPEQQIVKSPASAFEHYRGNRQVFRSYNGRHPFDNERSQSRKQVTPYPSHYGDQAVFLSHKVTSETPLFATKPYPSIVTAPPSFGSPQQFEPREIHRAGSDLTRFDALYAGVFGSFVEDEPLPPLHIKDQQPVTGTHFFADVFQLP